MASRSYRERLKALLKKTTKHDYALVKEASERLALIMGYHSLASRIANEDSPYGL